MKATRSVILLFVVSLFWAGSAPAGESPTAAGGPGALAPAPAFSLAAPSLPRDKDYLGLSGDGTFSLSQTSAKVVLVEVFSFYCPHCQRSAPEVNALFRRIEERSDSQGVIKLIGIGAGNSPYEVGQFKEKYGIQFPLFPDPDLDITRMLDVRATPTFVAIRTTGDGTQQRIYFHEGSFADSEQLLSEILKNYKTSVEKKP